MMLDYLYLLQQQTLPQSGESIRELLRRCVGYPKAFSQVKYWFRHFLHDGQSTFFDDERYMLFLEEWLSSPFDDKNEAEYLLNIVRKNRMGQVSEDFSFLTKEGVHQRLREIKAPLLLLYFTSPTCPACHRAQALLERSVAIDRLCDTGMKIAAICPAPEYKAWQTHPFPSAWITGFDDTGAILEDRLYEIQYYPCFYLLDAHGRVLLKEADLDRLEAYLRRFE